MVNQPLILSAALVFFGCILQSSGKALIINKSNQTIESLDIEACGEKFEFKNIQQDEFKKIRFRIRSESSYVIKVKFISGQMFERKVGYLISSLNSNDTISITNTDVLLNSAFNLEREKSNSRPD